MINTQYSAIQGGGGFDIAGVPFTLTLDHTELIIIYARMFTKRRWERIVYQAVSTELDLGSINE